MILVIRRRDLWTAATVCTLVLWILIGRALFFASPAMQTEELCERETILLDAGHGGADGGAVSADGTVESGINLAVTRKAYELLLFLGQNAVMTRTDEDGLYDEDSVTIRQKKVADTHNRVTLINSFENGFLLSIHQNYILSSPHTRGAQAFYNGQEGAADAAERIQQCLNDAINGNHPKTKTQISGSVYIMSHVYCPGVLVECGFLSNAEEAALLTKDHYQRKVALAVVCGYLNEKE